MRWNKAVQARRAQKRWQNTPATIKTPMVIINFHFHNEFSRLHKRSMQMSESRRQEREWKTLLQTARWKIILFIQPFQKKTLHHNFKVCKSFNAPLHMLEQNKKLDIFCIQMFTLRMKSFGVGCNRSGRAGDLCDWMWVWEKLFGEKRVGACTLRGLDHVVVWWICEVFFVWYDKGCWVERGLRHWPQILTRTRLAIAPMTLLFLGVRHRQSPGFK